jgi:hypothetical protein
MKSKIAVLALALLSAQASADWTWWDTNSFGTYYVDLSTIRNDGNNRLIWIRTDFNNGQPINGGIAWSNAALEIYKCNERQWGMKTIIAYSQKAQAGEILWSSATGNYQMQMLDIVPNTLNDNIFKFVCSN